MLMEFDPSSVFAALRRDKPRPSPRLAGRGRYCSRLQTEITEYTPNPSLLTTENKWVEEILYSDLLKSNCLVTGQPDWASIQIHYTGKKINHENYLNNCFFP